ncbi:hypothetical protein A148_12235 [Vibrio splendidus 1F-157]|nr:hypothetical protein A148_12235 [Vibrio splendidus 1F-157]
MIKQSAFLMLDRVFKLGSVLIIGVLCAREYSKDIFGLFSLVLAVNGIAYGLLSLGFENILIKRRLKSKYWKKSFVLALLIRLALSFFVIVITCFLYNMNEGNIFWYWTFVISISNLFNSFDTILSKYKAEQNNGPVMMYSFIVYTTGAILKSVFIFNDYQIDYVLYITVAESIILSMILLSKNYKSFIPVLLDYSDLTRYAKKSLKPLLNVSLPMLFSAMLSVLYMRVDQLTISALSTLEQLATYSAASRLIEIGYVVIGVTATAFFPKILNSKGNNREKSYRRCYELAWGVGTLLFLIYVFFVAPFTVFIYGSEYTDSLGLVMILSLGMPLVALRNFSGKIYISKGFYKHTLYRSIIGLATNVVLNFILVPLWGGYGASMATIFSLFVVVFVYDFIFEELKFNNKLKFMVFIKK